MAISKGIDTPAEESAREAASKAHPWIETFARAGYASRALIYLVIAGIAFLAAWEGRGNPADQREAIQFISDVPFGKPLLLAVAVGLFGYLIWRLMYAVFNPEGKKPLKRIFYAISGLFYGAVGFTALRVALGDPAKQDDKQWVRTALSMPLGRALVAAAGLAMACVAIVQIVNAIKCNFVKVLKTDEMDPAQKPALISIARIGLFARALVLLVLAGMLGRAALHNSANDAGGFDEALASILAGPFGRVSLALVAIGLIAYAGYMFIEAKYRQMVAPDGSSA